MFSWGAQNSVSFVWKLFCCTWLTCLHCITVVCALVYMMHIRIHCWWTFGAMVLILSKKQCYLEFCMSSALLQYRDHLLPRRNLNRIADECLLGRASITSGFLGWMMYIATLVIQNHTHLVATRTQQSSLCVSRLRTGAVLVAVSIALFLFSKSHYFLV